MKTTFPNLPHRLGVALLLVLSHSHSARAVEGFVQPGENVEWSQVVNTAAGPMVYDRDYYTFNDTDICTLKEPDCKSDNQVYSSWSKTGIQLTLIASNQILTAYKTEVYTTTSCDSDSSSDSGGDHGAFDDDDNHHDRKHHHHSKKKHAGRPLQQLLKGVASAFLGGSSCSGSSSTTEESNTREVPVYREENIKASPKSLQFSMNGQSFTYTSGPVSPELAKALADAPDEQALVQMTFEDGKKRNALIGKGTVRAWRQVFKH